MPTPPEVRRVILSHQTAVRDVRRRVERFASQSWAGLDSYRDADIDRLVDRIVPVVVGAEQRVAALTDTYLAALATASGFRQRPGGVPMREVTGAAVRGVDPDEVYRRPGVTVWTALSQGKPLTTAADEGLNRLLDLVRTDLQLTKTKTAQWRGSRDDSVVGYRRVLTGAENCALCTIASTQRYHKGDLLPIHPGCDCDIAEIRGDVDPGQVIDPERLEQLHQDANDQLGQSDRGGRAPDYRNIMVRDHGEYGPTLTWRRNNFTGPGDI